MATGIQTGIRRGSRGSLPASPTPPSFLGRCQSRWAQLPTAAKAALIGTALLLQVTLVLTALYSHTTGYVDLYPTKLQSEEIPEISRALLDMDIEHDVAPSNDGILVGKRDRLRARSLLAAQQLPLHRVLTADEINPSAIRTQAERKALEQRLLEGEIVTTLREMDGVRDARVKLSLPEKSYLSGAEDNPARASVTLRLVPGHRWSAEAIQGLVNLVAFSVPGLAPEKVNLLDSAGRPLVAFASEQKGVANDTHFQVRAAEERRLQEKLQTVLDEIMPGKARALVNLDLDFSDLERKIYTPGSEQDQGLVKDSFQLVTEMLDSQHGEAEKKGYENRKESVNYKYQENYYHMVARQARVERISATVFADGLSSKECESLAQSVTGSIGLQPTRGDFIYVDPTPWDRTMMPTNDDFASAPPLPQESPMQPATVVVLLGAQLLLLGAGVGGYIYLTSRRRTENALITSSFAGMGATGIVDHGRSKVGETLSSFGQTGVQSSTEALEGIVRERPDRVADLLRSTWLS